MRILIVHNSYTNRGGEDVVIDNETDLLQSNGHQVQHLFFKNLKKQSTTFKVKLLWRIFYNSVSAHKLKSKIKDFKPDIIHVHNFFYQASPSIFFVARKSKVPVVMTLHNYRLLCIGGLLMKKNAVCELCVQKKIPFSGIKHKCYGNSLLASTLVTMMNVWHRYRKTWQNKIDKYITLTDFTKQKLLNSALNLKNNQVVIKPNFVEDLNYTTSKEREDFYIFIGRLSKEKGIDILLKASMLYNFKVKIFGIGELQEKVENQAKQNQNIQYLGFHSKEKIIAALKKSKALIFPSIWYEGLPMTILESFSTGTPVIASDIGNINTIVEHQINGLHFKNGSAESLAQMIQNFEQGNFSYLYNNARESFEKKYSSKANYKNLIEIYQSVINSKT